MNIRKQVRTLVMAFMLALSIMSVPAMQVVAHAEPICKPEICGSLRCNWDGHTWYDPGVSVIAQGPPDGKTHVYYCDGTTGHWVIMRTQTTPQGPVAPQPVGNAPIS